MAITYDTTSSPTPGTGNLSWSHGGSASASGVLVFVMQYGNGTDQVTGVTYGGVTMTEVTGSPNLKTSTEAGAVYAYYLGSNVPTGTQQVVVSVNATATQKSATCFTVTGTSTTAVQDSDATINSATLSNPSVTLSLGGLDGFCAIGFVSGVANIASIAASAGWNETYEYDHGNGVAGSYKYDTIGTDDVAAGWSQGSDDAIGIAVALKEGNLVINKTDGVTLGESHSQLFANNLLISKSEGLTAGEVAPTVTLPVEDINIDKTETAVTLGETRSSTMQDMIVILSEGVTLGEIKNTVLPDNHLINKSEGVTLGEVRYIVLQDLSISKLDNATIGETRNVSPPDLVPIAVADTIAIGEVLIPVLSTHVINVTDNINIYDGLFSGSVSDFELIVSDNISLAEEKTLSSPLCSTYKTESITVNEVLTVNISDNLSVAKEDTIASGETYDVDLEGGAPADVGIDVSDTIKLYDYIPGGYTDNVFLGEYFTVQREEAAALTASATDTVSVGEASNVSVSATADQLVSVTDNITLGDLPALVLPDDLVLSVADNTTLGDVPSIVVEAEGVYYRAVQDNIGISETISVSMPDVLSITRTDGVTASDVPSLYMEMFVASSDNITVADAPSSAVSTAEIFKVDTVYSQDLPFASLSDIKAVATDTVSISDSPITSLDILLQALDTITVSEVYGMAFGSISISALDNIFVADTATVAPITLTVDRLDNIIIGEEIDSWASISLVVDDSVDVADVATVLMLEALFASITEGVTVREARELLLYGLGVAEPDIFQYTAYTNTTFTYEASIVSDMLYDTNVEELVSKIYEVNVMSGKSYVANVEEDVMAIAVTV